MIYSIDSLREYARDLDTRLADVVTYPDSWVDTRIEEGFAAAQDIKPVFIVKERYDLTLDFTPIENGGDGLTEVEIILQEEPHSIQTVALDKDYFTYEVTYNNHLTITKIKDASEVPDKTVTIVYYFHPTLPIAEIEMSMDIYRFVKEGIAAIIFSELSDEAAEKYHLDKAKLLSIASTLDVDQDALKIDDTKLWRKSWC